MLHYLREYAKGRRERHNRFRPADVAFFSSESDKNGALIFRKIRCLNIHFNIHMCIHFIAAKNLQLLKADNINHNLGVANLRKKGAVNWLCMVYTLFYRLFQLLITSVKLLEV